MTSPCGLSARCVNHWRWQLVCKWLAAVWKFESLMGSFQVFVLFFPPTVTTCWTPRSTLCCPCARTPICWTPCTASSRAWCTTRSRPRSTNPPTYKVLQCTVTFLPPHRTSAPKLARQYDTAVRYCSTSSSRKWKKRSESSDRWIGEIYVYSRLKMGTSVQKIAVLNLSSNKIWSMCVQIWIYTLLIKTTAFKRQILYRTVCTTCQGAHSLHT